MKTIFKLIISFYILCTLSCTDKGFTAFVTEYKILNSTPLNIELKLFKASNIETRLINSNSEDRIGYFSFDTYPPFQRSDSIQIIFIDGKNLVYGVSNCVNKNILCNSSYLCITGDTTVCTFEIDIKEYQKAK